LIPILERFKINNWITIHLRGLKH